MLIVQLSDIRAPGKTAAFNLVVIPPVIALVWAHLSLNASMNALGHKSTQAALSPYPDV